MNSKLLLGLLLVVIVAVGGYMLLSNRSTNTSQNQNTQTQNNNQTDQAIQQEDVNVTVNENGYEPQTVTIKLGTRVVWTNKSGGPVTVSSDAHPTHLLWPFLNLGKFDDGSNVSVVFEKSGTYTYHNHLNVAQTGKVIVQ